MKTQLFRNALFITLAFFFYSTASSGTDFTNIVSGKKKLEGLFNLYTDESSNTVLLEISEPETEFLYVNFLTTGVGSNDLGLDRGQIGNSRIVYFKRFGKKVLLIQPNQDFRAITSNELERQSVEEAFAQSVIAGFEIKAEEDGRILIDMTKFLLQDAHGVAKRLEQSKQGKYKVDPSKSAVYMPNVKNFPKNTELEALITFTGKAEGNYVRSVTPTPDFVSVRQRHSFVQLPDAKYKTRRFDPNAGFFNISYQDYAKPIEQPITERFICRHRLEKKSAASGLAEPVEPIIYYVDKGAPPLVKQALIEGASWWNEAFEAAGFKDAFIVKELPEEADPLDIRYNVIQWVHRSTRGWSYGSTVKDPRTGEIIKGHVSLGSLRVRQDFLIAQAFSAPYSGDKNEQEADKELLEMALARIRQLSAHEVGHTLGLAHNFAASYNDRASVMDYPHPLLSLDDQQKVVFSEAYDTGIGEWDKMAIRYGYSIFDDNEHENLRSIIQESRDDGLKFISDRDARPTNGAHPYAHLWDNNANPANELDRLLAMRKALLANFSPDAIKAGIPFSELEKSLAPLYFSHRYQTEAAAKLIGGIDYSYGIKGIDEKTSTFLDAKIQVKAISSLIKTLRSEHLVLPNNLFLQLGPPAMGYGRNRESIPSSAGPVFDPLQAANAAAAHSIGLLLNAERANRLVFLKAYDDTQPGLEEVFRQIMENVFFSSSSGKMEQLIDAEVMAITLDHLFELHQNSKSHFNVKAQTLAFINELEESLKAPSKKTSLDRSVASALIKNIEDYKKGKYQPSKSSKVKMPDGSPIGFMELCSFSENWW